MLLRMAKGSVLVEGGRFSAKFSGLSLAYSFGLPKVEGPVPRELSKHADAW